MPDKKVIQEIHLYYKGGSSDKVYDIYIYEVPGGFDVMGYSGPRGQDLIARPQNTNGPVTREEAQKLFDAKVKKQTHHRTTPYKEEPGGTRSASFTPEESEVGDGNGCQLYTRIDFTKLWEDPAANALVADPAYGGFRKYDGTRCQIQVSSAGEVQIFNRIAKSRSLSMAVVDSAKKLAAKVGDFKVDAESIGDQLFVFDLLMRDQQDCREIPLHRRWSLLIKLLMYSDKRLQLADGAFTPATKRVLLQQLYDDGLEGMIFKRAASPYLEGRSKDDFKYKFEHEASFIVMSRNVKASVKIAVMDGQQLLDMGNCSLRDSSFADLKEGDIIDVRYLYAFRGGKLAQPLMQRRRKDVLPDECTIGQLFFKDEPRVKAA